MTETKVDPREIDTGYEDLANAIVVQAVDDYRKLIRGKLIVNTITHKVSIKECEKFFSSEWCEILTKVDGKTILKRLRKEYEDECKQG